MYEYLITAIFPDGNREEMVTAPDEDDAVEQGWALFPDAKEIDAEQMDTI